jgi:hypothetical protein
MMLFGNPPEGSRHVGKGNSSGARVGVSGVGIARDAVAGAVMKGFVDLVEVEGGLSHTSPTAKSAEPAWKAAFFD